MTTKLEVAYDKPKPAPGSIVTLKEVYWASWQNWHEILADGRCVCGFRFESERAFIGHLNGKPFRWGIVVEHIDPKWPDEQPGVSLYLYDDEGRLLVDRNNVPQVRDFYWSAVAAIIL